MAENALSPQVFMILLSLAGEDRHGYAIIQDIAERSDGEMELTASTLYAALKRLLDTGWIAERMTKPRGEKDDPRRRYYQLTSAGRQAARIEARRLERLSQLARSRNLLPELKRAT
jgi:DNA-binding PadR family transcriptional regulator